MEPRPIRLVVTDDLGRSRLTVFFRLLLALPHIVWLTGWTYVAQTAAFIQWFFALISGKPDKNIARFLAAYMRYATHVYSFILLAGNPFPGFLGKAGTYPVDLEVDPPERQNRWVTGFRLILAIPAYLIANLILLLSWAAAILGWFASLALGRMPSGLRDAAIYGIRYQASLNGYLYLLTDRYPSSDPYEPASQLPGPIQPVRIVVEDAGERSRVTVFFRLLLVLPHIVWLYLWGIAALVVAVVNWFWTLAAGASPGWAHGFLSAYVRYITHVYAYLYLVANPFPGFTGEPLSYPVDVEIDPSDRQHRLKTLFRVVLVLPAILVAYGFSYLLFGVAFLGWFAALVTGRMPLGLRNAGVYALRYQAQLMAYGYFVLNDRYPYSGPAERVETAPAEVEAGPEVRRFEFGEPSPTPPADEPPPVAD